MRMSIHDPGNKLVLKELIYAEGDAASALPTGQSGILRQSGNALTLQHLLEQISPGPKEKIPRSPRTIPSSRRGQPNHFASMAETRAFPWLEAYTHTKLSNKQLTSAA